MRIAVLLDGSAVSEQALPCALSLLRSPEDELVLVEAVDALLPDLAVGQALEASHTLTRAAQAVRERGFQCSTRIVSGEKVTSLVAALEQTPVDLAVLCAPLRKGWTRWLRKSVSRGLAGQAPCPVLVVRPGEPAPDLSRLLQQPPWQPRHALVALDGSEFAELALEEALRYLTCRPAQLVLLGASGHTPAHPDELDYPQRQAEMLRLGESLPHQARRYQAPDLRIVCRVEDAQAEEAILDWAERERADLIALATHGRRGLSHWLWGSVGRGLLQRSRRPILLINPRCRQAKGLLDSLSDYAALG